MNCEQKARQGKVEAIIDKSGIVATLFENINGRQLFLGEVHRNAFDLWVSKVSFFGINWIRYYSNPIPAGHDLIMQNFWNGLSAAKKKELTAEHIRLSREI